MYPLPYVLADVSSPNRDQPVSAGRSHRTRRVRARYMKLHVLLLAVNFAIAALNTLYLSSLNLNFTNVNCSSFYMSLRDLNVYDGIDADPDHDSIRDHVVRSIYRRVRFIYDSMLCDCRSSTYRDRSCCSDRRESSIRLSVLLQELNKVSNINLPIGCTVSYNQFEYDDRQDQFKNVHSKYGHGPMEELELEDGTMVELDSSFYTTAPIHGAIPLVSEKVSLPDVGDVVSNIELSSVLPSTIASMYYDVNSLLLPVPTPMKSLKRPSVFCSGRDEYVKLMRRLYSLKMLSFTDQPKCINGAFGVEKDGTKIRLIIDATYCNSLMCAPPAVVLANPSHLSGLHSNRSFYVTKMDLSNYYHQLKLPAPLQAYFCLPAVSAAELRSILGAAASSVHVQVGTGARTRVYPMLQTLPMGWSHSVYIAQCVHEHVLYTMYAALSPVNNIVINCILLSNLHLVYIDDLVIMGYDEREILALLERVQCAYDGVGLKVNVKKSVAPTMDAVSVLGVTVNGRQQRMFVCPVNLLALIERTLIMLKIGECTGHALSVLIGHWCWYLLLNRKLLSVLQRTYRFVQTFITCVDMKVIWSTVRSELVLLCCLAPLLQIRINSGVASRIIATDASMIGYGVMANRIDQQYSSLESSLVRLAMHVGLNEFPCEAASFDVLDRISAAIELITAPIRSIQPVLVLTNTDRMCHRREIASLVCTVREQVDWLTIMSGVWRYNDEHTHINELELHSVLLSIRWLSSLLMIRGCAGRVVLLVDNAVVVYSSNKGRSSSIRLLSILRRITALCAALDVCLKVIYIPSELNPADAASRRGINYRIQE